ncbi:alpha/beta hydrolase [Legionella londiniensis]|nr:hypothetical protein [Legionella londiniensis]
MSISEKLNISGEHLLRLEGSKGQLEAALTIPEKADLRYLALLGHPHSLQGGTMDNKVVTTLARTFKAQAIPSLRFNFRGVGESAGKYDAGIGESEDMLCLASQFLTVLPGVRFIFAGFSFGSYVAYRAAAQCPHELLITIAPPVHHYDYHEFNIQPAPWIVAQGDEDEVVPLDLVLEFTQTLNEPVTLLRFADTGHFFHGKLIELKDRLLEAMRAQDVFHEFG